MMPIEGVPILTAAQMRATEDAHGDLWSLMRRAGQEVAAAVRRLSAGAEVLVLCGPGNNGGDGYVTAAALVARGQKVRVAALGEPSGELPIRARTLWNGPVETLAQAKPAPVVVDALFGTGLSRVLDDDLASAVHRLQKAATLTIAVDLPSGVDSDMGEILGASSPDLTLALGALKPAHLLLPAGATCGTVRLLDIGLPFASDVHAMHRVTDTAPGSADHKFSRGMVAVIAGKMPGAGALAASAAARIAGYTVLLGSATDRLPHAIVRRRWATDALVDDRIGAVVIGPGLGRDEEARSRLDAALASDRPLVIDGDALHLLDTDHVRQRESATILTPHGGEFAALFGEGEGSKIDRALAAADRSGATIVFKGADTVVATPAGQVRVATQHVPWLASAGTGDVLAGIIGALLAHVGDPLVGANDGVMIHTEAARRAGEGMIADDLVASIPQALRAGW